MRTPFETGPGFFGRIHQGNLAFRGEALQHLQDVMQAKPAVIDIHLDRPAVIPELDEAAAALLGSFGASDQALLDVIFGHFCPTGKLPFELPSSMEAVERQKEDVPYDSENSLFEFGFGLSYDAGQGRHPLHLLGDARRRPRVVDLATLSERVCDIAFPVGVLTLGGSDRV